VSYVSAVDYERILAIVAEASRGTHDEPLTGIVLDLIRELSLCDVVSYFEGSPWDRRRRRVWSTRFGSPPTEDQKRIVDDHRFDLPLYPSPPTMGRAIRISDAMSQRQYRALPIYRLIGRSRRIEYAMDYWMGGFGGPVRGLRFDNAAHDFSDRTRDAVELLGRHLRTVLARDDPGLLPAWNPFLTPREAEIVALVRGGRTNREIGLELAISPHTVRKHLENAFARIGVHSRAEAVAWTYRNGTL
jgi:DNA-binding CsgD family transcriptional regulator